MLGKFELLTPKTVIQAIKMYNEHPESKIFAGGTDVLVAMHAGKEYTCLLDLKGIEELKGMSWSEKDGLSIGALTTHAELERFAPVKSYYPALYDCISKIGSVQVRMRGTVAGNICTASPAGDSAAALLIYDAQIRVQGAEGKREIPVDKFFTGYKTTALKDGEIVTGIFVPSPMKNTGSASIRLTRRKAMDIGILCSAISITCDESDICTNARMSLLSAAPTPIRIQKAEKYLIGKKLTEDTIKQAGMLAYEIAKPKTWRSSEEYSRDMVKVIVPDTIKVACERMKSGNGGKHQ